MKLGQGFLLLLFLGIHGWRDATALVTVPAADCGINPVDIHFLLDASKSIKPPNFRKMINFVADYANAFEIGPDKAQIGITLFARNPYHQFWMNEHTTKASLLPAIRAIQYADKLDTYTSKGLDFVREKAFTKQHGGRDGVMHVLIVITDGKSSDSKATVAAAKRLHKENLIVLSVGVGTGFNANELKLIASDNSRYFHVNNFDALQYIQDKLQTKTCEVCPFWSGKDAVFIDGKCVRLFNTELTWDQAKAACEAEDPKVRLAEVRSEAVRQYIQDKTVEINSRTWLGATDAAKEGTWVWSGTGDTATIDPSWWGQGQPDNTGGNENCLIMRPDRFLNDYPCNVQLPYFCESVEVKVIP